MIWDRAGSGGNYKSQYLSMDSTCWWSYGYRNYKFFNIILL